VLFRSVRLRRKVQKMVKTLSLEENPPPKETYISYPHLEKEAYNYE